MLIFNLILTYLLNKTIDFMIVALNIVEFLMVVYQPIGWFSEISLKAMEKALF